MRSVDPRALSRTDSLRLKAILLQGDRAVIETRPGRPTGLARQRPGEPIPWRAWSGRSARRCLRLSIIRAGRASNRVGHLVGAPFGVRGRRSPNVQIRRPSGGGPSVRPCPPRGERAAESMPRPRLRANRRRGDPAVRFPDRVSTNRCPGRPNIVATVAAPSRLRGEGRR